MSEHFRSSDLLVIEDRAGHLGDCAVCYYPHGNLCTLSSALRTGDEPHGHGCPDVNPTGKCTLYLKPPALKPGMAALYGKGTRAALAAQEAEKRAEHDKEIRAAAEASSRARDVMSREDFEAMRNHAHGRAGQLSPMAQADFDANKPASAPPEPYTPEPPTETQLAQAEADAWMKEWNIGDHADIELSPPAPPPGHFASAFAGIGRSMTSMARVVEPLAKVAFYTTVVTIAGGCLVKFVFGL